jgi:hypothetical protein
MSESKRRRAADNLYGKVPQGTRNRGLVVSVPTKIDGDLVSITSGLDAQELRFSLLFWDELCWPQTPVFAYAPTPDVEFLEGAKILTRPRHSLSWSGSGAQMIKGIQLETFSRLDEKEPGKWALAQGDRSFSVVTPSANLQPGALIELHKAIPIPAYDVPLAEILEFKLRRRDELLLLRAHLESFAAEVSSSVAPDDELARKIAEVDKACSDLISVGKEWQFPMKLSSFKTSINIEPNKTVNSAVVAFGAGSAFFSLPTAAAVAGLAALGSVINIKSDVGFRGLKRPKNPYRYAYHIEQDLR